MTFFITPFHYTDCFSVRQIGYGGKALARCFEALDNYHRLNTDNGRLYRENEKLGKLNDQLKEENENLRAENKDYKLLRKVFGSRQIDELLERARSMQQSKQREKRFRKNDFER